MKIRKQAHMHQLTRLPRSQKAAIAFTTDGLLLPVALWMAFGFRLGPLDPGSQLGLIDPLAWLDLTDAVVIWLGSLAILATSSLYRIKLHTIDLDGIRRLAVISAAIGLYSALASFFLEAGSPRSIPVLYGASFFLLAVSVRIAALHMMRATSNIGSNRIPLAIFGAGAAGIQLAASLKQSPEFEPIMFVDENPNLHGVIVSGIRVKSIDTLRKAAKAGRIKQALIAIPSLNPGRKEELVRQLSSFGCEVKVIPSYVDLVLGRESVNSLRTVIPDDLLERGQIDLNSPQISSAYSQRSIMITGAGGSIGSELCRQILRCSPSRLVLFERSEPALYEISLQLQPIAEKHGIILQSILGSVTDRLAVAAAVSNNSIDVVLHAAAYKHVPLLEHNEVEGAHNNIVGTQVITDVARDAGIERFVLVSTDKAVRPTNVMGATKSLAEMVIGQAQCQAKNTVFTLVRFGNVLGSSGSVVPLFARQIASGGPVTLTHENVTRFFMTIPEAAGLVLLAGAYAQGDDLFVLNMGEPVKIMSLARRMIQLSGRTVREASNPDGDVSIDVVGLRPGEKMYEELLVDDDDLMPTPHTKILRAQKRAIDPVEATSMLDAIHDAITKRDDRGIRQIASRYVEGYCSQTALTPPQEYQK